MIYEDRKPGKNWKTRRRYCLNKNDDGRTTILHPYRDCEYNIRRSGIEVVRHRVCTHCCADFHNSRLVGEWVDLESWRIYLQNIIISRHYDYAAIWNMIIWQQWIWELSLNIGERLWADLNGTSHHDNAGYLAGPTHLRVTLNEVCYFCFLLFTDIDHHTDVCSILTLMLKLVVRWRKSIELLWQNSI